VGCLSPGLLHEQTCTGHYLDPRVLRGFWPLDPWFLRRYGTVGDGFRRGRRFRNQFGKFRVQPPGGVQPPGDLRYRRKRGKLLWSWILRAEGIVD
jgi:hypothetical protein